MVPDWFENRATAHLIAFKQRKQMMAGESQFQPIPALCHAYSVAPLSHILTLICCFIKSVFKRFFIDHYWPSSVDFKKLMIYRSPGPNHPHHHPLTTPNHHIRPSTIDNSTLEMDLVIWQRRGPQTSLRAPDESRDFEFLLFFQHYHKKSKSHLK